MITVIIPAHNEEGYIGPCLEHILKSTDPAGACGPVQVVVVANGCADGTVAEARAKTRDFDLRGWRLDVLDLKEGGKLNALNAGDRAALHGKRVYIDADIHVTEELIAQLSQALERPEPAYAGGRPRIRPPRSFVSEHYARFWEKLPFMARAVPGCGVYAVNAAGRARWVDFPPIIADDTFVRYHFAPHEMHGVPATYSWPITEGFRNLVRVRRRQDQGVAEVRRLYPELTRKVEETAPNRWEKLGLFLRDPLGFLLYAAVAVTVRLPVFHNRSGWDRGR